MESYCLSSYLISGWRIGINSLIEIILALDPFGTLIYFMREELELQGVGLFVQLDFAFCLRPSLPSVAMLMGSGFRRLPLHALMVGCWSFSPAPASFAGWCTVHAASVRSQPQLAACSSYLRARCPNIERASCARPKHNLGCLHI